MEFKVLRISEAEEIAALGYELNPTISETIIRERLTDMFRYTSYRCFGMYLDSELIAISSGWLSTRLYSGKQLEVDNVIVSSKYQSRGYGKEFLSYIEGWAIENNCRAVELNTYVTNERSHKFYFNQGYKILGYHFQKMLNT